MEHNLSKRKLDLIKQDRNMINKVNRDLKFLESLNEQKRVKDIISSIKEFKFNTWGLK